MTRVITHSKSETQTWGRVLAESLQPGTLLTLQGDLGAGKTTLTQGLLEGLGALSPYSSPTFVLMNQYDLPKATSAGIARVYHADAYRVGRDDFEKLGFLEWCDDLSGLVILEWPEKLGDLVPEKRIEISIRSLSENEREITIENQSA